MSFMWNFPARCTILNRNWQSPMQSFRCMLSLSTCVMRVVRNVRCTLAQLDSMGFPKTFGDSLCVYSTHVRSFIVVNLHTPSEAREESCILFSIADRIISYSHTNLLEIRSSFWRTPNRRQCIRWSYSDDSWSSESGNVSHNHAHRCLPPTPPPTLQ